MSKLTRAEFHAMHQQAAEALERSAKTLNVLPVPAASPAAP